MEFYSPLRYPGGKGKVAHYFKQIFKDNQLCDGIYAEPYAGGASVALSLLLNEYASKIIINDIDRSIYAFWHSVLHKTSQLCKLIKDTPVTVQTWEEQKKVQGYKHKHNLLALGFSTFFLNRTNRSGILNGGIIGGKQQTGEYKIDARYNKDGLICRIERIARYRNKIELYNSDAIELLKCLRKTLQGKSLFYFDPPYYVKGPCLYYNSYQSNDHKHVANEIGNIKKQKWIVTYDNVRPIRKLYSPYRKIKYSLNYCASKVEEGEEVMIFSNNLSIPKPAK